MFEDFIDNAKLLVSTLGYKAFEVIDIEEKEITKFYIEAARGASATGAIVSDGFIVFKDSIVASSTTPSISEALIKFRKKLYDTNVINSENRFTKDYVFTSPSYAAGVVMGRNANGKTEWKTVDHKTIHDIEVI